MTKPFDPTKPCQTNDGAKARIVCTDLKHPHPPILALVMADDGREWVWGFRADGTSAVDSRYLVNVPEKTTKYISMLNYGYRGKSSKSCVSTIAYNNLTACISDNTTSKNKIGNGTLLLEIKEEDGVPVEVSIIGYGAPLDG